MHFFWKLQSKSHESYLLDFICNSVLLLWEYLLMCRKIKCAYRIWSKLNFYLYLLALTQYFISTRGSLVKPAYCSHSLSTDDICIISKVDPFSIILHLELGTHLHIFAQFRTNIGKFALNTCRWVPSIEIVDESSYFR